MVTITADTVEELAKVQNYIIGGMNYEGTADFEGTFKLSSGNHIVTRDGYWKYIVGEKLPDGSVRYIERHGQ